MAEGNGAAYTATITDLGDRIAKLTIVEAVQLKDYLKEKYKIEPAAGGVVVAGGAVGGGAAGAGAAEKPPEQTEFAVVLDGLADPAKKIGVIKVVREITNLGLKEAKDKVEGAPQTIKENVAKDEANTIKKKLEDAGAKVSLK
jgi:large subunit ribosomal protein L7/L12